MVYAIPYAFPRAMVYAIPYAFPRAMVCAIPYAFPCAMVCAMVCATPYAFPTRDGLRNPVCFPHARWSAQSRMLSHARCSSSYVIPYAGSCGAGCSRQRKSTLPAPPISGCCARATSCTNCWPMPSNSLDLWWRSISWGGVSKGGGGLGLLSS